MRIVDSMVLASLAFLSLGCNNDDDDDDGTSGSGSGSTGSAWLVGDDGEMLRLTSEGATRPYSLATEADLNAIACLGTTAAWVVGSGGTVLSTADSGESWQPHDVGTDAELVAVAVDEHDEPRVVIAGDGVLLSRRGDADFASLHDGDIDWRAVALAGDRLLAVSVDGRVWRADHDAALTEVAAFDAQGLSAVALAATTDVAVVVGELGFVARSDDGGSTWSAVAVPTIRDLWAVRVSADGDEALAVGDAGVVVRIDESGATAQELLDPALSLRAVHIHGQGEGHTVGDAGTALVTADFGATWQPISLGVDTVLRGVDAIRVHSHW